MAPSYRPSAQAADWQRPFQLDPFARAYYTPVNGLMQYGVPGTPTLVGPNQVFQPGFAGFVRPPALRDSGSVPKPGFQQQGPAQARSTWDHQRLNHSQQAHPVLGQRFHQQQRHLLQPTQHASNQDGQPQQAGRSWAPLNGNAKPFVVGSPRASTTSSGTADMLEASDVSSVGSTTPSVQTSITGEYSQFTTGGQELRRVESRLKSSARPYVPLSPAVHQQSPAQRSGPTRIADTQADAAPSSRLQPKANMQHVVDMLLPQGDEQQPQDRAMSAGAAQSTPRSPSPAAHQTVDSSSPSSAVTEEHMGHAALLQPELVTCESSSTAVAASASSSNSCQTVTASEAGTDSLQRASGAGGEAAVTPAASSSATSGPSGSVTQQTAAPHPADNAPSPSVSSPEHESGLATHLTPNSHGMIDESDSSVSGGDVAGEQAPAQSSDGSQASLLLFSPTTAAPPQSGCSREDAEQSEHSSSHANDHSHHYGREEEEHPGEQNPSQLPGEEEDEQSSKHSAPLLLPLPLPLPVAQEVPKKKPGLLAKTMFCTVCAPVLVPVLAVGGCLQLYDALSVQHVMWKYTMAGSQEGYN